MEEPGSGPPGLDVKLLNSDGTEKMKEVSSTLLAPSRVCHTLDQTWARTFPSVLEIPLWTGGLSKLDGF